MRLPGSGCAWMARVATLALVIGSVVVFRSAPALAAAANDDFASASPITVLPFADSGDLSGYTIQSDEPQACGTLQQSEWYVLTQPTSITARFNFSGSDYGVTYGIYRSNGGSIAGLQLVGCNWYGGTTLARIEAGSSYYLQVGTSSTSAMHFSFSLNQLVPPPNDDFAAATRVGALPFTDTVAHLAAATREDGDPFPCAGGSMPNTVWWSFTPAESKAYMAELGGPLNASLAVYTGTALADLHLFACGSGSPLSFAATAGTTYYILGAAPFTPDYSDYPMTFRLDVTPPPTVSFYISPPDPSIYDSVQFRDQVMDPAWSVVQSEAWTFGDGAQAAGCCVVHTYATDGDYPAGVTVTMRDGRTASTVSVVRIWTHDVAITRLAAPTAARVGRTSRITAYVSDTRYPETVQVQLFASSPGSPDGFAPVGTLTQSLVPKAKSRTTPFDFDYTFTSQDAAVGKVTFKAQATIVSARDALPADNTAIAPVTRVSH